MLFQKMQQTYFYLMNSISFPVCSLLTNHETLYNINIVLSFHPPFEPITVVFTITGLWHTQTKGSSEFAMYLTIQDETYYISDCCTYSWPYFFSFGAHWKGI